MDAIIGKYSIINPKLLSRHKKIQLAKSIYRAAHTKVFKDSKFKDFFNTIFDSPTYLTRILVYKDQTNVVGYATLQAYKITINNKACFILMSELCFKSCYHIPTKYNPTLMIIRMMMKFVMQHPFTETFIVDTLLSPYIYRRLDKLFHNIYPRRKEKIPAELTNVLNNVADYFHWDTAAKKRSMVRHLNWKLRSEYAEYSPRKSNYCGALEFYQKLVPDYEEGNGLVIIVPMTLSNMVLSTVKIKALSWKVRLQKINSFIASMMRLPRIPLFR